MEDETDIVIVVAGGNVDVKMENGLAGDGAIVCKKIESFEFEGLYQGMGDGMDRLHNARKLICSHFQKVPMMPFGDDQGMSIVDRINIENGERTLIFIENFRGYFPGDNIAKYAGHVA